MMMCTADEDYLSSVKDFAVLKSYLPENVEYHEVKGWSHMDFLWSTNAKDLLYPFVIDFLVKNNK